MLWKLPQLEMLRQVLAHLTSLTSCATSFPCTYEQNLWLVTSSSVSYASNSFTCSSLLLGQGLFIAIPTKYSAGSPYMHVQFQTMLCFPGLLVFLFPFLLWPKSPFKSAARQCYL